MAIRFNGENLSTEESGWRMTNLIIENKEIIIIVLGCVMSGVFLAKWSGLNIFITHQQRDQQQMVLELMM